MYQITVKEIKPNTSMEHSSVAGPAETEVFKQVVETFDVGAFARALNPVTRKRRSPTGKGAKEVSA